MKRKHILSWCMLLAVCNGAFAQAPVLTGSTSCPGSVLTVAGTPAPSKIVWKLGTVGVSTATPTFAASATTVAGSSGVAGNADNQLNGPSGVAVDASGNIYVSDEQNHRVMKWAPGATSGVMVAGTGIPGNGANQFTYPIGVFVDGSGNIYVGDANNHRVQKWAPGAAEGITVAGGHGAGLDANQLTYPYGVYVDASGNVYVADAGNNRIQKWAPGAPSGTTVAGTGSPGAGASEFNSPLSVVLDASGNMYIADHFNARVQKWAPGATSGTTVAGNGTPGAGANQLDHPLYAVIDGSNNIYVTDAYNHRVQRWAPGATSGTTVAGITSSPGNGDNQLNTPYGVFVDPSSNIYIGDMNNHRVQKVAATIITTLTATTGGAYKAVLTTGTTTTTSNTVTINTLLPITGTASVCSGFSTTLSDATAGGTWASSNTNAIVASGVGVVIGAAAGTATITYTAPSGCATTAVVTINQTPAAIATGSGMVCVGSTAALTDATTGGTWTSSATGTATIGTTGVVSGLASGTTIISYTLPTGCKTGASIVVNPLPSAIMGTGSVCAGATTPLTDATSGGTWSSSNANATVGTGAGLVTGVTAGTAFISYTRPTGCYRTAMVTINPSPVAIAAATGSAVCSGSSISLSNATTGGAWTSSSDAVATVGTSGVVTGGTAGVATISYTLPVGCMATASITVNALPAVIAGPGLVCTGATASLTNSTAGGTWSSSNANATVGTGAGLVTGVTAGTSVISYIRPTGCFKTATITINPSPASISPAAAAICSGTSLGLSDATSGGTWTTSASTIAAIGTTGTVTGAATGVATIAYTLATGCKAVASITVNPLPASIMGTAKVCTGLTTTLTDATTGGTWSASNSNATVESGAGVVSGATAGTSVLSYALPTGCYKTVTVTVNPTPSAISGANSLGTGTTTALSIGATGGTWASGTTAVATINTSGVVNGVTPGTALISYSLATGCRATKTITVNLTPAVITGTAVVCATHSTTLHNATTGGSWSINNTAVATIDGEGVVTGVGAGNTTVSYTMPTGTFRTIVVSVNPLPNAGTLTGISTTVGVGGTILLTNSAIGGVLTSSSTAIATVNAGGTVTGISIGSATITYTHTNGCGSATSTLPITVEAGLGRAANTASSSDAPNTVIVFPNPTNSGNLTVKTSIAGTFQVYEMSGKSVGQYTINEGSTLISLPNALAAGMYLGRFTDNNGNTTDMRIVYKP